MPSTSRRPLRLTAVAAAGALIVLAACDAGEAGPRPGATAHPGAIGHGQEGEDSPGALVATLKAAEGADVISGDGPHERSLGMSQALFESAPVVVVVSEAEQPRGASAAATLGVPVLVDGDGEGDCDGVVVGEELERLGAQVVLTLGEVEDTGPVSVVEAQEALPATTRPEPRPSTVVLTTGSKDDLAALGTARAAGAEVVEAPDGDPRSTSEAVRAIAGAQPTVVLGLGDDFGDDDTLDWRARTAATGVELPGGGQLVLPDRTYVALYGTPGTPSLGVLGEQPPEATVTRAQEMAAAYQELTDEPVVPTLEIIVSIASDGPGEDGNYSTELPVERIRPLVDLAGEHGLYVVLDLQPGRTDFLTQAQRYEELLERPYVGLALDPEWRLRPDQEHLTQIGQVDVDEVNDVVAWLADLTRQHDLPQKVLVLHQFQARMIPEVDEVDRSRSEVAVLVHADGQGAQPDKQQTWRALHDHAPDVEHWGWKNFYDEDVPGPLTPEETMSLVDPVPDFISYQ
jgi:hypothetical protein